MNHHDNKIFANTDSHLVMTLQQCANIIYARKIKLTNLKEMTKTVAYIQEHGYHTLDDLDEALAKAKDETSASRKELTATEHKLKELNKQIHYTGQYLAYKSIYSQFCKSNNKVEFQQKHSRELALYRTAVKFLKEKSDKERQPSMKLLKENKEDLLVLQKKQQEGYQSCHNLHKELNTVHSSILMILDSSQAHQSQKRKQPDIIS